MVNIRVIPKNGKYAVVSDANSKYNIHHVCKSQREAVHMAKWIRANKYPLQSSYRAMVIARNKANARILKEMGASKYAMLQKIANEDPFGKHSTIHRYQNNPKREAIRRQIIRQTVNKPNTIDRKHPDLYIFGGIAGSAKSSALRKKVPEEAVVIDPDEIKTRLAKYTKSPIKGYKLAHANRLHEESSMMAKFAQRKAMRERRDVILDTTMANLSSAKKKIAEFRAYGYHVHLLGTELSPVDSIKRTTERFLKKGRYVPAGVIVKIGNTINNNVLLARKYADNWYIIDTTNKDRNRIVSQKGY